MEKTMVAVSFFFVLLGSILLFLGIMGIFFMKVIARDHPWLEKQGQNIKIITAAGIIFLILGLLMATT
ncbi:hypothetical protein P6N53_04675 [Desulforamulus aquiferis]|uniref:DUF350 domain-containing protein n=2 Tax=Desulforamulus aquiferis TaxID=1397668 RepID=A0AAW7ZAK2_9FIRM|nr:hypothetical protein [Desulforamulus aquiferis]